MKTCEICGRSIKTGKKYCWEHRHTAQANIIREDKEIDRATKAFKIYKLGEFWDFLSNETIMGILLVFAFMIGLLGKPFFDFLFSSSLIGGIVAIILASPFFILPIITFFKKQKVDLLIRNRDDEYITFVKSWISTIREEKNFRKDLLK